MKKDDLFWMYEPWIEFVKHIKEKSRFRISHDLEKFLQKVLETAEKRKITIKKGRDFVRARIGAYWFSRPAWPDKWSSMYPHPLLYSKMGAPPRRFAKDGRLNPRGIPYLYLASDKNTAIAEVRPWINQFVTVGEFQVLKNLNIVDTTKILKSSKVKIKNHLEYNDYLVWRNIDREFSKPVSTEDDLLEYLPTQYLADLFKSAGYDGVKYNSSVIRKGYNLLIFNIRVAKCNKCRLYSVSELIYKARAFGRPETMQEMATRRFY